MADQTNILIFDESKRNEVVDLSLIEKIVVDLGSLINENMNDYERLGIEKSIEIVKSYNATGSFLKSE
jgi:hypothetical protein